MAEKRKLLAEIEKCFKKIDEGVELFEEIMNKMQEANSDNQREKYQDDLKKEIKKLQRLRDQVKGWQNSSDIKDKEKLTSYRKVIEGRMEQFKDIERENKTKPHSKQGLIAEEKMDPREKERVETIEWLQAQIREFNDENDRTEVALELIHTGEGKGRRGKKDDARKGDKEKKMEELKRHLDRMKFHIGKLEICMRMVNNESLESATVMEVLKDPLEMYVDALPDCERSDDPLEHLDPQEVYEELNLVPLCAQLGTLSIGSMDDEKADKENGTRQDKDDDGDGSGGKGSRHGSSDGPASPALRSRTVVALGATTHQKLVKEPSSDGVSVPLITSVPTIPAAIPATTPPAAAASGVAPPPPPGIPYNSVAAGRAAPTQQTVTAPPAPVKTTTSFPISTARAVAPNAQQQPVAPPPTTTTTNTTSPVVSSMNDENRNPVTVLNETTTSPSAGLSMVSTQQKTVAEVVAGDSSRARASAAPSAFAPSLTHAASPLSRAASPPINGQSSERSSAKSSIQLSNGPLLETSPLEISAEETKMNDVSESDDVVVASAADTLLLRMDQNQQSTNTELQKAHIPAWLGASPLGRVATSPEMEQQLTTLEGALGRNMLPFDSERPRTYLPKIQCPSATYYPQTAPANGDTLEYYLRLAPDTLFFIFYYMEGTRAQLLAAKALKKLSWRFHTKYLTWFQRHEEPKQITDDFEQGTYVYFDFEKWSQRKKEAFTFEYRFLEDRDFD